MCLAQGPQRSDAGEARTRATVLPMGGGGGVNRMNKGYYACADPEGGGGGGGRKSQLIWVSKEICI